MIVAIEGIDGAGKHTAVTALAGEIDAQVTSFPRYEQSIHAQLAQEALYGRMGDVADSAYAMATLFALDRRGVQAEVARYVGRPTVLLLDRYVASNAAYTWARTGDESAVDWVAELEFARFQVPAPDLTVLWATQPAEAARRARRRHAGDATRSLDAYERDADLQARTYAAYEHLAEQQWHGRWLVTNQVNDIVKAIAAMAAADTAKES